MNTLTIYKTNVRLTNPIGRTAYKGENEYNTLAFSIVNTFSVMGLDIKPTASQSNDLVWLKKNSVHIRRHTIPSRAEVSNVYKAKRRMDYDSTTTICIKLFAQDGKFLSRIETSQKGAEDFIRFLLLNNISVDAQDNTEEILPCPSKCQHAEGEICACRCEGANHNRLNHVALIRNAMKWKNRYLQMQEWALSV